VEFLAVEDFKIFDVEAVTLGDDLQSIESRIDRLGFNLRETEPAENIDLLFQRVVAHTALIPVLWSHHVCPWMLNSAPFDMGGIDDL
jgi:hypothetical protein